MKSSLIATFICLRFFLPCACAAGTEIEPSALSRTQDAIGASRSGVDVTDLRCEYLNNPLGIDELRPRLSWILQSARRAQRQTAYRVLVASDQGRLARDRGDLWDSGPVMSEASTQIVYAGRPLGSRQRCFWKVRVWDQDGRPSAWSPPASWSMGLLSPGDWQAQWIGLDEGTAADAAPAALKTSRWIWHGVPDEGLNYPPQICAFRRSFQLPADRSVTRAIVTLTADNQYEVRLDGDLLGRGGNFHVAEVYDVTHQLQPGLHVLTIRAVNAGDQPNPAGLLGSLVMEFDHGAPVCIPTDATWEALERMEDLETLPQGPAERWTAAHVLGRYGMAPWGDVRIGRASRTLPARMLRREWTLMQDVKRATATIAGLGYYELWINGAKVGDHVLDPVLTDYDRRVPYVTYDVTDSLRRGANAVGVILGNGRYFAPRLEVPTPTRTFGYPKLCLQLDLDLADGKACTLTSDPNWTLTTEGPIRANNDYDGEVYDATRERFGWSLPGFDDSAWRRARPVAAPLGKRSAQMMPPMRVTQTIAPVALSQPQPGVWIYDMGQNMVGWCRLTVRGPAGTRVQLRHAETLQEDGLLYTDNLRSAQCRDTYVLKGDGLEVYEPRFTYHGFRYVELTGYPGTPDRATLQGRVVHTDLPRVGSFTCSHPLLNRLVENIEWGLRGNYLSIPTDCPQRDERQGWQGDRAAESRGETFLFDHVTLYNKWLHDIRDSQKPDGNLSDVCPAFWPFYSTNVTWPSAYTIIPQTLLLQYGDQRNIERHYTSMKRWMEHLGAYVENGIIDKDNYGDWCVPPEDPRRIHSQDPARVTSKTLLATSYYYHNLRLLAQYATRLEQPEEAARFSATAALVKTAFNQKFFRAEEAMYDNGTQSSSVLPLAFGLVPGGYRQRVFDRLVDHIVHRTDSHIGTGLIGGQWLMRVLSDHGRADLAYRLATNTDYPSWGYMVENGATTIWELWNGNTADPAMNSGNHVMLVGDLLAWCFETLAGIRADPAVPGFKHILMKPQPVGDLTWVKAEYRSVHGLIRSHWRRDPDRFQWDVTIPANTDATIYLPTTMPYTIYESGQRLAESDTVVLIGQAEGRTLLQVPSGRYSFTCDMK
jgi:alpha-L-rhamnosidase